MPDPSEVEAYEQALAERKAMDALARAAMEAANRAGNKGVWKGRIQCLLAVVAVTFTIGGAQAYHRQKVQQDVFLSYMEENEKDWKEADRKREEDVRRIERLEGKR